MKLAYEVGEECWIVVPMCGEDGEYLEERVAGKVEFYFDIPDAPERRYVIRVSDPDYPSLEVRDAYQMAATADGLMPFERRPAPLASGEAEPIPPPGFDAPH